MNDPLVHEASYRGAEVIKKMGDFHIAVCGAGAVGSNLVVNLSRQGFKTFTVIDDDRIEAHNIPTQVWSRREVGLYKVAALKNLVFNVSGASISAVPKRIDANNVRKYLSEADLVVDGFDNSASRALVTEFCKQSGKDCLHVGLAKDYAEVIWNESYRVPKDTVGQDICDYPMARNTILLAVAVASEVIIKYVSLKEKHSYSVTLGDFKVEEM